MEDEIVKEKNLGYPLEIKEIFTLLSNNKIISKEMEVKLKDLIIARNKLAHRYGVLKKEEVFKLTKETEVIKNF